jgi:hypothetical protein
MRTGFVTALLLAVVAATTEAQTLNLTERLVFRDGDAPAPAAGWQMTAVKKDRGPHPGTSAIVWTRSSEGAPPGGTEYRLIGASGLGALPTVDLLGIHYIRVQPAQGAAFEKFVADKLNPTVGKLRPDLRFLYYKNQDKPDYICIVALTKASRDKYWPNGSDSEDLKAAFTPAIKSLATELQTYLVDGTWGTGMTAQVYEAKEWADWVIVAGGKGP